MSSIGAGYDLSVATFSPDGRVFQVEYAAKAIEATGLTIGAIFKDGVLLAVDKYLPSAKLIVPTTMTRVFKLAPHVICAVAGALPDARQLVARAREECSEYQRVWGVPISGNVLADRLGLYVHSHTAVWSTRPFGCAILLAVAECATSESFPASKMGTSGMISTEGMSDIPSTSPADYTLWVIDPTGAAYRYRGVAIGKGNAAAKSELERMNLDDKSCEEGLYEFAKILHQGHAEVPERTMKMEMIWLRSANFMTAELIPADLLERSARAAEEHLERLEVA